MLNLSARAKIGKRQVPFNARNFLSLARLQGRVIDHHWEEKIIYLNRFYFYTYVKHSLGLAFT